MKMQLEIREVRQVRGVTALADRFGYSPGHISLVLRGERAASKALAARLRRLGYEVREGVKPGAPRAAKAKDGKGGAE